MNEHPHPIVHLALFLAACLVIVLRATGAVAATETACPVTRPDSAVPIPPAVARPIIDGYQGPAPLMLDGFLGNDLLWVILPPDGVLMVTPSAGGSLSTKLPWVRIAEGTLTITARRIDGTAPPAHGIVPDGYGRTGFQASGIEFPTEGCWEITGAIAGGELRFVLQVVMVPGSQTRSRVSSVPWRRQALTALTPEPGWAVGGAVRIWEAPDGGWEIEADVTGPSDQLARDNPRPNWPNLIWHIVTGDCASWSRASAMQATPKPSRVLTRFIVEVEAPGSLRFRIPLAEAWLEQPLALAAFVNGGGPLVTCADLPDQRDSLVAPRPAPVLPTTGAGALTAPGGDTPLWLSAAVGGAVLLMVAAIRLDSGRVARRALMQAKRRGGRGNLRAG